MPKQPWACCCSICKCCTTVIFAFDCNVKETSLFVSSIYHCRQASTYRLSTHVVFNALHLILPLYYTWYFHTWYFHTWYFHTWYFHNVLSESPVCLQVLCAFWGLPQQKPRLLCSALLPDMPKRQVSIPMSSEEQALGLTALVIWC